jgi:hypothetical protein
VLLLHDVRRLVRDQPSTDVSIRSVATRSEVQVRAGREGMRAQLARQCIGRRIVVHAHGREVRAKVALEGAAKRKWQLSATSGLAADAPGQTADTAKSGDTGETSETGDTGGRYDRARFGRGTSD